jgi:hypothetical protein
VYSSNTDRSVKIVNVGRGEAVPIIPATGDAEAGESPVQSQLGLHSETLSLNKHLSYEVGRIISI